ncbi:hypothetical protein GGR50DRAFT_693108 [Xylaria sp. CBS 124048]|nr:hypothetical protein GGR50DRAFT_693108 [Xylaria sp. CBS 124048]
MKMVIPGPANLWLDGASSRASRTDQTHTQWPKTASGSHADISHMTPTNEIVLCKSLPGIAYIGPDKHTRKYRIKHRRCWPLLPRMDLYGGPNSSSPIWATYRAISLQEAWIELPCRSTGSTLHGRVKVFRKLEGRRNRYVFTMKIHGHEETFGWRRSQHPRTKSLGLSGNGYKLVRLTKSSVRPSPTHRGPRTSDKLQIVAIAGRSHHQLPRCAAFRYLTSYGEEWEVVSLMTLMALWVWDRKHMTKK